MIIKSFEERKIDLDNQKCTCCMENQGQIDEFINNIFKKYKNCTFHMKRKKF